MANEATVRVSLSVRSGATPLYQSTPSGFSADMAAPKGPSPGAITVTTAGVDVDLAELSIPGLCFLHNTDDEYTVEYGIHDGSVFHPFGEMLPGEQAMFRFSKNLGEEHVTLGTGTTATVNSFHMKAYGGSAIVKVECFLS
jgi:hypothetical protein